MDEQHHPLAPHPVMTPQDPITIHALVSDDLLDQAFGWLCQQRKDWPANSDVWRFRRDWTVEKARLHDELLSGRYEIGLLDRVTLIKEGEPEEVDLWPARDAMVMKALAWTLQDHLPLSSRCLHLKGHGGLKRAVCEVYEVLPQHQFILKTDVQSYHASIDHGLLLDRLSSYEATPPVNAYVFTLNKAMMRPERHLTRARCQPKWRLSIRVSMVVWSTV